MTTTAHDIATTIHNDHGVTLDAAAEAVEGYIALFAHLNDRAIDRDAVDHLDAGMVEMAFAVARHNGGLPKRQVRH